MEKRLEAVFVDTALKDWKKLIAGFGTGYELVLLDPSKDGLAQIAGYLSSQTTQASDLSTSTNPEEQQSTISSSNQTSQPYDAIHFVSHGSEGHLYLGNTDTSARLG